MFFEKVATTQGPRETMPVVEGVTHRFVDVRGIRFHVADAGAGEPVVLLHGFPQHWYAWHRLVPELAGSFRLLCLDLRGCGWSDAPPAGYDTKSRAADVLAVMDELGLDRVRLIGHDTGGWLGFMLCLYAPQRFSSYLAINTSHPWPQRRFGLPLYAWRFWYTAFWEYPHLGRRVLRHWPGFTRFMLRHWVKDKNTWDPNDLAQFVAAHQDPARSRAGEQQMWQFVLHDIPAIARGHFRKLHLTVPTLMLTGDVDPVSPPTAPEAVAPYADDLTMRTVVGGHLLPEESPSAVADAARELFRAGSALA